MMTLIISVSQGTDFSCLRSLTHNFATQDMKDNIKTKEKKEKEKRKKKKKRDAEKKRDGGREGNKKKELGKTEDVQNKGRSGE